MEKVKIGIIGLGVISGIYCKNLTQLFTPMMEIKALADINPDAAKARAEEFGIDADKVVSVDELLADPEIEIVLNLTIPYAHYDVCRRALEAGKNVYVEKPLSVSREDGKKLVDLAKSKGLLLGGAPDTFMGGGIQTSRKLIDDGWIGTPVAATAFMMSHGHESWHPAPEFYYKHGGGPMFDMGPYYLTALVNLMGPVASVAGATRITFPQRTITSEPKYGQIIDVEVPTHVAGLINFESGAIGTIITTFDVWGAELPRIEIYGTLGSLSVPDPNTFGGVIKYRGTGRKSEWQEVPTIHGYTENSRGLGVTDMAYALRYGRKNRASGDLTYHVLDVMHGFHDAANTGTVFKIESTCEQPKQLPINLLPGTLDA